MKIRKVQCALAITGLFLVTDAASAGTVYVASNGVDGTSCATALGDCGTKTRPCRSIRCGIEKAVAGDTIVVGPGRYDSSPTHGGEQGSPGCGCMVSVNKPIKLTSSDGAAATVIDGTSAVVGTNVLVIAVGAEVGKPGKGFTITNTARATDGSMQDGDGIVIDGADVRIRGNLVLAQTDRSSPASTFYGNGIRTVTGSAGVVIEANLVSGWNDGILLAGASATVRRNQVSLNDHAGITASGNALVLGNVVKANSDCGIELSGAASAIGNAVHGHDNGIVANFGASGIVDGNNLFGNQCGFVAFGPGLQATRNYWGASTGPGADPADELCGTHPATVAPVATSPFKIKAPIKP